MQERLGSLIGLSALLAACGNSGEAAFNAEFDRNFAESCIASAARGGVPEATAATMCECALKGINEQFSMADKMTMSPEQAQPIMAECMSKVVQQ